MYYYNVLGDMKKFFVWALMSMITATMCGQVGNGRRVIELDGIKAEESKVMRPDTVMPNGEWQKVIETKLTAKEGFKYMRQVLAKLVPDYQRNVQLEDTADCKLIMKVALPLMARKVSGYWLHGQYNLTLTVAMKDNRYRVSGEEVKCQTGLEVGLNVPGVDTSLGLSFDTIGKDTDGALQRDLQWKAGQLVVMIDKMLRKQVSEEYF